MVETETNPIRVARKSHHKTLQEFAKLCGINYQTLLLNEAGVFPTILPKIRNFLTVVYQLSPSELDTQYRKFVLDKRTSFALEYSDRVELLPEIDLEVSPIRSFREHIDPVFKKRMHFCKTICIEPAIMYRLELGKVEEFPRRLNEALLQVGVPSENINELRERQYEFYARSK